MDKELRYGRVQVLESTTARVHVRWTYQSTDFLYQVWAIKRLRTSIFILMALEPGSSLLSAARPPSTN